MKWLIAIAVSFLAIAGKAQLSQDGFGNWISLGYTNKITNSTPATIGTIYSAASTYHTLQVVTTNAATLSVGGSIDGTNYAVIATNTMVAGTVYSTNIVGKFNNIRVGLAGTNVGCNFNYMGR